MPPEKNRVAVTLTAVTSMAFMGPSMAINALHALNTPSTLAPAFAGASVMSVLLAASAPFVLKRKTDTSIRALALAAFVVCTGYNLQCAIGASSLTRSEAVGSREAEEQKRRLLDSQVKEAEATRKQLAEIVGGDTVALIDATLATLRQDARWHRSESCASATRDDSRAFCAEYAQKLASRDAAGKIGEIDLSLADLKKKLIAATGPTAGQASDPQAENIRQLLGMIGVSAEAARVGVGMNIWFALTVEVLAAIGPVVISVLFSGGVSPRSDKKGDMAGDKMAAEMSPNVTDKNATVTEGDTKKQRVNVDVTMNVTGKNATGDKAGDTGGDTKTAGDKRPERPGLSLAGGRDVTITAMVAASSAQEVADRMGKSVRTIRRWLAEEKAAAAQTQKKKSASTER